ncbi:MAG: phosphonopyruvate decarboxylase [Halobacteriovoraceae bacterium]|nr:phosphonopyruvate decarboxylase [Halobacteriovoraceae bacterium]
MILASDFLRECKKREITLFTGTPCSYLKPFINSVIDDSELDFVEVTNEGDAVAIAAGAYLGNRKSIIMFQNSGLGNAVNPLTSLAYTMKVPFIGIVTLRGEPDGPSDEPQHDLMGQITTKLLEEMDIPWSYFPTEENAISRYLDEAESFCEKINRPYFFVMKKDSVKSYELKSSESSEVLINRQVNIKSTCTSTKSFTRSQALECIIKHTKNQFPVIATTGKTGRELYELSNLENHLYMVGSMGCALPIGLGIALSNWKEKIIVIDGDGALLMRLGNMALAGQLNLSNIIHILLDNGVHDSTGGQKTYSELIDFCKIAQGCGYENIKEVDQIEDFDSNLAESIQLSKLTFIRFHIKKGSPKDLGRPTERPFEIYQRLKNFLSHQK